MSTIVNIEKQAAKVALQDINDITELESVYLHFMQERSRLAQGQSIFTRFNVALDNFLFTQKKEYLDLPDFDEKKKHEVVTLLHKVNLLSKAYQLFYVAMLPHMTKKKNKKLRILELGSGAGEFLIFFANIMQQDGFDSEIIGSDYNGESIRRANERVAGLNLSLTFIELNMFELENYLTEPFDFIFINQAIHHFSLPDLVKIYRQCAAICRGGIFALDGYRSFKTLALLTAVGSLGGVLKLSWPFCHDSIVSAMKFFPRPLLVETLRFAVPEAKIDISAVGTAHIFVEVILSE